MKAYINRRSIVILSSAFLIAIIAIISVNVFDSSGPVTGVASAVTRPVRVLASTVARTFGTIFSSIYRYEELAARNDELERRIVEMETNYRESQDLREENESLRRQLNFRARYGEFEQEMAAVESWGGDNWSSSFTIDLGSTNSGIRKGMGVVTFEGALVGQIYEVGATESIVITILDTRFSASALVGIREAGYESEQTMPAVVMGDFSLMGSGLLKLEIDDNVLVRTGDYAVTAGKGVFPSNLVIGEIQEIRRNPSGIGRYAYIKPMVTFDTLNTVFVITGFEPTE